MKDSKYFHNTIVHKYCRINHPDVDIRISDMAGKFIKFNFLTGRDEFSDIPDENFISQDDNLIFNRGLRHLGFYNSDAKDIYIWELRMALNNARIK